MTESMSVKDIFDPSPTREVTRLITYRGPGDELDAQLGKSLPDGTRQVRRDTVKITVRTLADTDAQLLESADTCALILRLGAVVRELSAARLALRDAENELQALRDQLAAARQEAKDARANLAQWQSAASNKTDSGFLGEVLALVDSPDFGDDHTGVVNWLSDFATAVRESRTPAQPAT